MIRGLVYLIFMFSSTSATTIDMEYCQKGDAKACYELGQIKENKFSVPKERLKDAADYLEKSCSLGYAKACEKLADFYKYPWGLEIDKKKSKELGLRAVKLYEASCEKEDAEACYGIGSMFYFFNDTVDQNLVAAFNYFAKGCDLGHYISCDFTAKMYEEGMGTKKNIQKAIEISKLSCEDGYKSGCVRLAWHYYSGSKSTKREHIKAANLIHSSCAIKENEQDKVNCSENMVKNIYKKACKDGYTNACNWLEGFQ